MTSSQDIRPVKQMPLILYFRVVRGCLVQNFLLDEMRGAVNKRFNLNLWFAVKSYSNSI